MLRKFLTFQCKDTVKVINTGHGGGGGIHIHKHNGY